MTTTKEPAPGSLTETLRRLRRKHKIGEYLLETPAEGWTPEQAAAVKRAIEAQAARDRGIAALDAVHAPYTPAPDPMTAEYREACAAADAASKAEREAREELRRLRGLPTGRQAYEAYAAEVRTERRKRAVVHGA